MRSIRKGPEPSDWRSFRIRAGASYDDVDAPKESLREALVREQGGLCCYCLARVRPTRDKMRIEHWAARTAAPSLELDYNNLLAACPGAERDESELVHCDVAKRDQAISLHPARASDRCEEQFVYSRDGTIAARPGRPKVQADIETLVLNHHRARAGRRAVVDQVLRDVTELGQGVSRSRLSRMADSLEERDAKGQLQPFCQAGVFWLRRQVTKR